MSTEVNTIPTPLTHEQRQRLIREPLPIVRVIGGSGSHAGVYAPNDSDSGALHRQAMGHSWVQPNRRRPNSNHNRYDRER